MEVQVVKRPRFDFEDELINVLKYKIPPRKTLTKELQKLANNIQGHINNRIIERKKISFHCLKMLISVMYYNAILSVSTTYPYLTTEIDERNIQSFFEKSSLKEKMKNILSKEAKQNADLYKDLDSKLSIDYNELFRDAENINDDIFYIIKDFKKRFINTGRIYTRKMGSKSVQQKKSAKRRIHGTRRSNSVTLSHKSALQKLRRTMNKKYKTFGGENDNLIDTVLFSQKPNYDTFVLLNIVAPFSLFTDSLQPHYRSRSVGGGLPLVTSMIMIFLLLMSIQHSDAISGFKKKKKKPYTKNSRGNEIRDIDFYKLKKNFEYLQEPGNFVGRNLIPRSDDVTNSFQNSAIVGSISSAVIIGAIVYAFPVSVTTMLAAPVPSLLFYGGAGVLSLSTGLSLGFGVWNEDQKWMKEQVELEKLMKEIIEAADKAADKEDKRIQEEIKLVKNLMTNFNKNKWVHSFAWYITSITNYQAKSPEEMKFLENPFKDGDFAHNHTLWATGEYITNSTELNETNKYDILLESPKFSKYQKDVLKNYIFITSIIHTFKLISISGLIFIISYNTYIYLTKPAKVRVDTSPGSPWPSASPDDENKHEDIIKVTQNNTFITKLRLIKRFYQQKNHQLVDSAIVESQNYKTPELIINKINEIKTSFDDEFNKILCILLLLEYHNILVETDELLLAKYDDNIVYDFVNGIVEEISKPTSTTEVLVDNIHIVETQPIEETGSIVDGVYEAASELFSDSKSNSPPAGESKPSSPPAGESKPSSPPVGESKPVSAADSKSSSAGAESNPSSPAESKPSSSDEEKSTISPSDISFTISDSDMTADSK